MKITTCVLEERCIGCGKCYLVCPEVYSINDDGIAYVIDEGPYTVSITEKIADAKRSCPTAAIKVSTLK